MIVKSATGKSPRHASDITTNRKRTYFGARRVRGKRGRGARGKTIVFGVYKRNGRVYTEIIRTAKKANIQAFFEVS